MFVEKAKTEDQFLGWSVLSEKDYFDLLPSLNFFVAIGDNYKRKQVATDTTSRVAGAEPATLLHPASNISSSAIVGAGTLAMPGVHMGPLTRLGAGIVLNANSTVCHETVIEDFASLAPNACVAGRARIGKCSAICLSACVAEKVNVGSHTVVGAGSAVLNDLPVNSLAFGIPAKVRKARLPGDRYLR